MGKKSQVRILLGPIFDLINFFLFLEQIFRTIKNMQNFYQIRITSNLLSDFLFVDALLSGFDLTIKKNITLF